MFLTSYIPEGNQARMHFWSVHRDPRNYSYPDTFWPERWLIAEGIQESKEKLTHNPDAFIPFSFGPANCVGKNLAMLEMRTVACALLQRFRVRLCAGWDKARYEEGYKDYFSAARPELPVLLEPRW